MSRLERVDDMGEFGVYDCTALVPYPDQMVRCGARASAWWKVDGKDEPVCSAHDRSLTRQAEAAQLGRSDG